MSDQIAKNFTVKAPGSKRPMEHLQVLPGTTVAEVLASLNLNGGYQLSDAQKPEIVFHPTDVLYARIEDGALLYASSMVDAG